MAFSQVPHLLKHTTVAIYKKRGGQGASQFEAALEIALAHLKQSGYLSIAVLKPLSAHLTARGIRQNRKHLREGAVKTRLFDQLYQKYQLDVAPGRRTRDAGIEKKQTGTK